MHGIRGHPCMTSAKFWDFLTPSPLVRIWDWYTVLNSRNLPYYIFFWANRPSPPQYGRHIWMPTYGYISVAKGFPVLKERERTFNKLAVTWSCAKRWQAARSSINHNFFHRPIWPALHWRSSFGRRDHSGPQWLVSPLERYCGRYSYSPIALDVKIAFVVF